MVDRIAELRSEAGTTLVELLVVIVLVGVVGSITTMGIVQSFQAQRDVTGAAESLDESRIAIQRMRDVIRGADEICSNAEDNSLVVWTDSLTTGTPGVADPQEVVTFEVDDATNRLTQQEGGGGPTVLISDEIIEAAVFVYDIPPDEQVTDLRCQPETITSPSAARTSRVEVQLEVNNPASDVPLTTQTAVQLRNAGLNAVRTGGLVGSTNQPPTAVIWAPVACIVDEPCPLNGSGSTDPEGATLNYAWDLDGDDATGDSTNPAPAPTFGVIDPATKVILVVQDEHAATGQATATIDVRPTGSNLPPKAAFTFECDGATCSFDAINGGHEFQSEPDTAVSSDPDGDSLDFLWEFDGEVTSDTSTAPALTKSFVNEPVTVSLTVTDGEESDTSSLAISATDKTIRVGSLRAVAGTSPGTSGDPYDVSLTVAITSTSASGGVGGAEVTVSASAGSPQTHSCTTNSTSSGGMAVGECTFAGGFSVPQGSKVIFTVTSVTPPGEYTYDPNQNRATTITVGEGQTVQEPS